MANKINVGKKSKKKKSKKKKSNKNGEGSVNNILDESVEIDIETLNLNKLEQKE